VIRARRLAVLFGVAAGLVIWAFGAGGARHPRVMLIGIDGADPAIIERLIAQGKLPTFARLSREGAFGRLRSREPLLSPVLWTTIATGHKPQDHGVLDFVEVSTDGRLVPITSSRRRVPALWNIASQFGHTSGFVGWYASFPVEAVRGFEVSDRLGFHQVKSERTVQGAAYPRDLVATLQQRFGEPAPDISAVRARFLSRPDAPVTADGERRLAQLARIHATTEYYRRITPWLQDTYRPELLGVYFEAVDACSHLFMEDAPPRRSRIEDADFEAFSQTVDRCYEYQDEVLADVLALANEDTLTIICSDHGFKSGDWRPDTIGRADEGLAPLWHLPNGVLFLHGASARAGSRIDRATILDIAPTALHALGVPLASNLPGRALQDAFEGSRLARAPARVDRYAWTPVPPPDPSHAASSNRLTELQALGYVSGSGTPAHDEDGRTAASYLNEGISLAIDGEQADALRAFERALQLDPPNVNARAFAARVHLERREFEQAKPMLDEAVALDPRSVYARLLSANLAIGTRQWHEAETQLAAAAQLDARLPMLHVQRARFFDARADFAKALDALATAETLTDAEPLLLDILVLRADAASQLGRKEEAAAALRRAGQLAPPDRLAAARAEVALLRNDAQAALTYLRAAAAQTPRSAGLWALLGATYGRAGAYDEAIDAYERSVALAPSPLACKTLAALLFEIRHDRARAVSLWRQSLDLDPRQPDVRRFLERYDSKPKSQIPNPN
jgi:tetratricopeptide (TPR) repeat protein